MGLSFAAPLAGRDAISSAITGVYTPFQSTHPLRGATVGSIYMSVNSTFQSTHPLRGATLCTGIALEVSHNFNPRTPCGVRQQI